MIVLILSGIIVYLIISQLEKGDRAGGVDPYMYLPLYWRPLSFYYGSNWDWPTSWCRK